LIWQKKSGQHSLNLKKEPGNANTATTKTYATRSYKRGEKLKANCYLVAIGETVQPTGIMETKLFKWFPENTRMVESGFAGKRLGRIISVFLVLLKREGKQTVL